MSRPVLSNPRVLRNQILVFAASVFASANSIASADITLAKVFSDNMVLQRNSSIKIWGTADSNQNLQINFLDQRLSTMADANGNWSARIITSSHGGPYDLEVASEGDGPKVVLSNVMVGEVWLCSGQSNMEWPMTAIQEAELEIQKANEMGNLRLFTVGNDTSPVPLDEFTNVESWRVCNSRTVRNFSAVAYFFGRELSQRMNGMPIGLIDSTWGGTPAEAWVSRPAMEERNELLPLLRTWDERPGNHNQNRPAHLFNGMIAPLAHVKLRGAIWYQGESNNGRGAQYRLLLPTLIDDWRSSFGNSEMPFYFVQIAPFRYSNISATALAEVWDAQVHTLKNVPHTGMIVTTDIADFADIHPKNKQDVGLRLARVALGELFHSDCPDAREQTYNSPLYVSYKVDGKKVRIHFEHVGDGLESKGNEELREFSICGADGKFVAAHAEIADRDHIVVWSNEIEDPIAVRFCWNDTPTPNLFNSVGLPASPFRTDDFELESANVNF